MSYDLVFWKQTSDCTKSPSQVHLLLLDGAEPEGLLTIPVESLLDRVREVFPGVAEDGGLVFWEGGDRGMFEVGWSPRHILFCCRDLDGDDMNRLIDIAHEFECSLYDPQTGTRFSG
jgi:hypothetical protein